MLGNTYADVRLADGTIIKHLHKLQMRRSTEPMTLALSKCSGNKLEPADPKGGFSANDCVDVCVDGHLPELWAKIAKRLKLKSEFINFPDFMTLQIKLCGALSTHTRIVVDGMETEFFVNHYPWWNDLFNKYHIGDSDSLALWTGGGGEGGGCNCGDAGPVQLLTCSMFGCGC